MSATFRNLFPDTFDRAIPVIRHKGVDKLLLQLDSVMWQYEQAEEHSRSRGGRRVRGRTRCCGLLGARVDLILHYQEKMLKLQDKVREARKVSQESGSTPSW